MKLYHLSIRKADGTYKRLTGYAMNHGECLTMKSKFTAESQARILLDEAGQCTHSAGFYQFEGDMICRTCGENQGRA
jgi:hypothetical protein